MPGVMCPVCERRLPRSTIEQHKANCKPRAEGEEGAMPVSNGALPQVTSFTYGGVEWQVGMRVVTRCCLASVTKKEYPAGSTGCIFEIIEVGLMRLWLDNPSCRFITVEAEPRDVDLVPHYLPPKTVVESLPMRMYGVADNEELRLAHRERGVIVSHDPKLMKYRVAFNHLRVTADLPVSLVMPVKPERKWFGSGVLDKVLAKARGRDSGGQLSPRGSPKAGPLGSPEGMGSPGGVDTSHLQSVHLQGRMFSSFSLASSGSSGTYADEDALEEFRGIRNLAKHPEYSNLTASPRSPSRAFRADSPRLDVCWSSELTDLLPEAAAVAVTSN